MGFIQKLTQFVLLVANVVGKYLKSVFWLQQPKLVDDDIATKRCVFQDDHSTVKPFSEIPGPRSLPIIGSQWLYCWPGPYTLDKLHLANEDKYLRHGPVVKEHYLWNFPIIHLYDKHDIEEVLKYPSKYPVRPELEAQSAYRRSRPDRYFSVGLVNSQGPEWHHLRSKLTTKLASPSLSVHTVEQLCLVSDELVDRLRLDREADGSITDFDKYVYRFGLEAIVAIMLNQRLGALKNSTPPLAEKMMRATDRLFQVCHETMYGLPWWKYLPSKAYKELISYEDAIYEVFADIVHKTLESSEDREQSPVLDQILDADDVDQRDKIATLIDLITAGIETTGNAMIFLLNHVLADPSVKVRVYEELDLVLASGDSCQVFTPQLLLQLKYLRACVAESLRLSPVAPNVARLLEKSYVFQNYHVPAGTLVVCQTWVASLQEENYPNARQFMPERWLASDGLFTKGNPFFEVPFGVGRRMCPGKRIAEYELLVLAAKLFKSFDMSFDKPVEKIYKFLIAPKGPLKMFVSDR